MKYLAFDTETSGLPDYKLPADDPSQPRLAHLAVIRLDENFVETDRADLYVKPDGWKMEPGATAANGLTDEFLTANGVDIETVLKLYESEIRDGRVVVAFNAQFDCKIMRGEFRRKGWPDLFEETPNICVMRPMVKRCGLKQAGSNRAKWPSLTEALAHFGHVRENAHKAVSDAEGVVILLRELSKVGELPKAAVHYAKNKPEGTPGSATAPAKTSASKGLKVKSSSPPASMPDSF